MQRRLWQLLAVSPSLSSPLRAATTTKLRLRLGRRPTSLRSCTSVSPATPADLRPRQRSSVRRRTDRRHHADRREHPRGQPRVRHRRAQLHRSGCRRHLRHLAGTWTPWALAVPRRRLLTRLATSQRLRDFGNYFGRILSSLTGLAAGEASARATSAMSPPSRSRVPRLAPSPSVSRKPTPMPSP